MGCHAVVNAARLSATDLPAGITAADTATFSRLPASTSASRVWGRSMISSEPLGANALVSGYRGNREGWWLCCVYIWGRVGGGVAVNEVLR